MNIINTIRAASILFIFCLTLSAQAQPVNTILSDDLVFSELECFSESDSENVAYTAEKSILSFPLRILELSQSGWLRVDFKDHVCWISPNAIAQRKASGSAGESEVRTRGGPAADNQIIVKVNYATNRKVTGSAKPSDYFGGERGDLVYGNCEVSIPRDHRLGQLEQPDFWRLEFNPDPKKHVALTKLSQESKEKYFSDIRSQVGRSKSRSLFVFVHGYNVNFADAARRTAQMTYDLGYDGAPIFFSWPSQGKLTGYMQDENNNEWSIPDLQGFLADLSAKAQDGEIYLVAHSMGNRLATRALARLLTEQPKLRARFREVMLVAPDIDTDVFKRDIAPTLLKDQTRVTLYASQNDKALAASKTVHGLPRLGDAMPVTLLKGMDTIDASNVETDLIGHSYFAEAKSVLRDIFEIIRERRPVKLREWLSEVRTKAGMYWKFARP